jgi:hypothetical protein
LDFENEDEEFSFERLLASKMKQRCPFPGELKMKYDVRDACKEGKPLFKRWNGARSTVTCALAGMGNHASTLMEVSSNAKDARQSRFFQPTTSFAFSSVQMSSQETINFWGMFVMMLNATVRTRNVCTMRREKAVHANFPVHL